MDINKREKRDGNGLPLSFVCTTIVFDALFLCCFSLSYSLLIERTNTSPGQRQRRKNTIHFFHFSLFLVVAIVVVTVQRRSASYKADVWSMGYIRPCLVRSLLNPQWPVAHPPSPQVQTRPQPLPDTPDTCSLPS